MNLKTLKRHFGKQNMTTNLRIPKVEKDKKHDHKLKKMKSRQKARTIANLRT
jgi:hypothetical protein